MRIVEILLPKGVSSRDLSPKTAREIDALQTRIDSYVDKIGDPRTSRAGKEFLKVTLKGEYDKLRGLIGGINAVAEADEDTSVQYEIFDRQTGNRIPGRGPYNSKVRARRAVDQLDNAYGAYKHGYRPIPAKLKEAVHKLPLTQDDFDMVKHIMERPIPAAVAPIFIAEIIQDDELNDQLLSLEDSNPGMDVRPLIAEWFERVMPDQRYRFVDDVESRQQKEGILSPIHGYDPKMYRGTNDPLTGNAYGSY